MKVQARFRQLSSTCCRSILFASILALVLCFAAPFAGAQSTGGRIRGTVMDTSGGAVPGASVTLINEGTHATREVQSGANGEYIFLEVPVGTYEIGSVSKGFKRYARKGIVLDLNEVVAVDITLQIGTASDVVEVTGAPPVVDTTSTQLGAVVNERSSTQLPLNTRDVFQLLQLQPGVQSQIGNNLFYGSDKPGVVTVNGGRGRSNNYSVNGGDSNDLFANLPAVQPSPDSIEEFRVITNTFDAEYGRNSGAVVNVVTKSGTNDFHGSAYEFLRNDVLNAHGFTFQPTPKPPFKQNQFGGTLGGPIKRDKSFFFGSYEGRRIVRGIVSQNVPVPTGGDLAGTFTAPLPAPGTPPGDPSTMVFPGLLNDPTVATILQNRCGSQLTPGGQAALTAVINGQGQANTGQPWDSIFPTTTGPQNLTATIPTQCFDPVANSLVKFMPGSGGASSQTQDVVKSTDRADQFQLRFDQILNKDQKFSLYYYYNNDNTLDPFAIFQLAGGSLGNFPGRIITHAQQLNASHSWTLGSTAVNEFRFTYFREAQPQFYTPTVTNAVTASCGSAVSPDLCFGGTTDTPLVDANGNPLGTAAAPNTPVCPGFGCGIHPGLGSKFEGVPYITLNGTLGLFGNNFEGQLPQTGNTFQFNENYSKIIGKHSFKFGGDIRYQRFDQKLFFNVNGEYIFGPGGANDTGAADPFANYLLGLPVSYSQGSANTELVRTTSVYLFAQDSWKIKSNVTLNYGLRWEVNTPLTDIGKKVQRFNPGQNSTIFPCDLSTGFPSPSDSFFQSPANPTPTCANTGTTPTGLVVPGDKGVPGGLFSTYYKAFAPRIGLNWSPGWKDGTLAKLTGGPNKTTVSMGWGLFYNPIEQLVLEQFSAEPPFGISNGITNPLFSTPFVTQEGATFPNVSDAFLNPPRNQPVDWALYRPILLFGQFPTNLRPQYSAQYNLTVKRELPGNILLQVGYVGSQGHRLLAIHDQNAANPQTCLDLIAIGQPCGPFSEDNQYQFNLQPGQTLHMPYIGGPTPGGPNIPCAITGTTPACTLSVPAGGQPIPINLVGLRPYASPNCNPTATDPLTSGCPADGTEVFNSIFAEDNAAHSNYNSLQALFEKRFSHGLQFQASYTYSKSLDNASSFEEILNPLNFNSTYGPSLFDSRHRFVFNYVWELPVPKFDGFKGKALNGWQVSGIYTYQSGFPILINNCDDQELQGSTLGFECPGKPDFTGAFKTHNPRIDGNVFDPTIFTDSALGQIGNVPRTLCCNPPINNWDVGIFKDTAIGEKTRLEFRTEIYNIFNHAQFYGVDGGSSNPTFGQPQKVRDPRLFQFALKLIF
jgi:hypothetical protein